MNSLILPSLGCHLSKVGVLPGRLKTEKPLTTGPVTKGGLLAITSLAFIVYVYCCVCMYVLMHVCTWKAGVEVGYLSLLFSA